MSSILIVLLLTVAAVYVVAALEAKEIARDLARRICADARVQLLDQTVSLRHVRLVRTHDRLALRRRFVFEFSSDGASRERGTITLLGRELESASVPVPPAPG